MPTKYNDKALDCIAMCVNPKVRQLTFEGTVRSSKTVTAIEGIFWRIYEIYSVEHDRAYYPYRCVIDRAESIDFQNEKQISESDNPTKTVDFSVKWSIINNKEYFEILKTFIGEKRTVANTVATVALRALRHRDRSDREDLYLIDARNGKEVAKNTSSAERLKVLPTEHMKGLLEKDDGKQYILFHNHPLSSPPSVADLNSLYKNPKIKFGVIVGHNGTAYKYTAPKEQIEERELKIAIVGYLSFGYSQKTAERRAWLDLANKYNFILEFRENE